VKNWILVRGRKLRTTDCGVKKNSPIRQSADFFKVRQLRCVAQAFAVQLGINRAHSRTRRSRKTGIGSTPCGKEKPLLLGKALAAWAMARRQGGGLIEDEKWWAV